MAKDPGKPLPGKGSSGRDIPDWFYHIKSKKTSAAAAKKRPPTKKK